MVKSVLFLLTSAISVLHAQNAPAPGKAIVTVLNSVTKQPVDKARVTLQSMSISRPPVEATTSVDGRAEFGELLPGRYAISEVKAAHFIFEIMASLTVPESATVQATSLLVPTGEIQGTVLDEDGKPVFLAIMHALHFAPAPPEMKMEWVERGFAQTDTQGRYKLTDLAPGRYLVRVGTIVNMPGKQQERTFYPSGINPQQAIRLDVRPGSIVDRIDLRLRPAEVYHVRGTLTGSTKPQGTVFIEDCDATRSSFVGYGPVAADGTFDAPGIRPGAYCVNHGERPSSEEMLSFAIGTVTVVDRDVDGISLVAEPPRELSGEIVFDEGVSLPMPTALSLSPRSGFPAPAVESKVEGGRFTLNKVLPINYRLNLTPPAGSYIKSIKGGGQDFTSGIFNPLGLNGTLTIQIAVARGRLTGRVTNGTDKPAAGLTVTVVEQSKRRDLMKAARTDERGEFTINGLAPGSYKLLAWERVDTMFAQAPEFLERFSGTVVKLADGEERNVEVRMIPAREVEEVKGRF